MNSPAITPQDAPNPMQSASQNPAPATTPTPAAPSTTGLSTNTRTQSEAPTATPVPPKPAGSGVMKLLGNLFGNPVDFKPEVGPDGKPTGKVVQTPGAPQTPGTFFRHMLAGALLGGTLGSQNKGGGFAGGLARGGAGAIENNQAQQEKRRENSRQDVADTLKKQNEDREDLLAKATIAHYTMANVVSVNQLQMARQDHVDEQNKINDVILDHAYDLGAKPASIVSGGKVVNPNGSMTASEFGRTYTKDKSIMQAPDGYYRVLSKTFDTSELTWNPEKTEWDDKDGKAINPGDYMRVTPVDVPRNAMKEPVQTKGSELNTLMGSNIADPDKMYPVSMLDKISLGKEGILAQNEKARTDLTREQLKLDSQKLGLEIQQIQIAASKENRALTYDQIRDLQKRSDDLSSRLKSPDMTFTPEEKKQVQGELDKNNSAIDDLNKQLQEGIIQPPAAKGAKAKPTAAPSNKIDITAPVNAPAAVRTPNPNSIDFNKVDLSPFTNANGQIQVQIPGQKPGLIDAKNIKQFLIDNPNAHIVQ